jgi:hypothetical protein
MGYDAASVGTGVSTFHKRHSAFIFKGIEVHKDEGTLFLQNSGNRLSSDMVLYPIQTESSAMLYKCV